MPKLVLESGLNHSWKLNVNFSMISSRAIFYGPANFIYIVELAFGELCGMFFFFRRGGSEVERKEMELVFCHHL